MPLCAITHVRKTNVFIAHLPAGYLLSVGILSRIPEGRLNPHHQRTLVLAGLIGSVLPDIDLIYFYLISNRSIGHHAYWTHIPIFWLALTTSVFLASRIAGRPQWGGAALFLCVNVLLHLALDTVAAPIKWLYPWSNEWFQSIQIPRHHSWWVFNYLTHWTMLLELTITGCAGWVAWRCRFGPAA